MNTKRLAVVCNYVLRPDRIGGMDRFFVAYDRAAKAKGYDVDWFFPDVLELDFYTDINVFSAEGNSSVEAFFLKHLKEKGKLYTALVTHFTELCTPFYKKAKQDGMIKTVIAVDHNPRPLNGFPIKKRIKKKAKGFLYHRYIDRFIGVSSASAKNIITDFGPQIRLKTGVIFNGIATEEIDVKIDPRGNLKFIVASHLRKEKAVIDVIEALKFINNQIIKIDIFGEGPEEKIIEKAIADSGLKNQIRLLGSKPNLHGLYKNYDYLIHPSCGETFGLSVIESLMSNIPVITTKNAGNVLGEVVDGKNGYLFSEGDIYELGRHLDEISKNEKSILKTNHRELREKYSLDRMVAEHINLLD